MDDDRDAGGFRFGPDEETDEEGRVTERVGNGVFGRLDPPDPQRLEPGTPSLESVVFVVLGMTATVAAFALMFPFL